MKWKCSVCSEKRGERANPCVVTLEKGSVVPPFLCPFSSAARPKWENAVRPYTVVLRYLDDPYSVKGATIEFVNAESRKAAMCAAIDQVKAANQGELAEENFLVVAVFDGQCKETAPDY